MVVLKRMAPKPHQIRIQTSSPSRDFDDLTEAIDGQATAVVFRKVYFRLIATAETSDWAYTHDVDLLNGH